MISAKALLEYSSSLSILYAEDEELLRDGLSSTLTKLFKYVYIANDGQEAIDLYDKHDVDIILTDINMPNIDGVAFIRHVKASGTENQKVIVLTAHKEAELLITLIDVGINSFINKPVEKEQLIEVLYHNCQTVMDHKMVLQYEQELQESLTQSEKQNRILNHKLEQIAHEKNKSAIVHRPNETHTQQKSDVDYFENLLPDDLDELSDLEIELSSYIYLLFNNRDISLEYISKLATLFSNYARVLNTYMEFADIGSAMLKLSQTILDQKDQIFEYKNETATYLESFELTLLNFKQKVWDTYSENPRYYNASLISDMELITQFLIQDASQQNDVDFF